MRMHLLIQTAHHYVFFMCSCHVLCWSARWRAIVLETQNHRTQRYTHNTHRKYDGRIGNGRSPPKGHGSCHCHDVALRPLLFLRPPRPANRVRISSLNLSQNEASFPKSYHEVKKASSSRPCSSTLGQVERFSVTDPLSLFHLFHGIWRPPCSCSTCSTYSGGTSFLI